MVEFFLAILLMLVVAWLLGEALHRVGQPALVGQILGGVLIGPSILNIVTTTAALSTVESVALFFIMLLTGLAVKPSRIIAAGRRGVVISTIAFAVPFVAGTAVASAFGISAISSLTVGLTVSITAVPVNAIVLMELGILDTDLGAVVIAAGVVDDIISLVALSVIQQFPAVGSTAADGAIALDVVKVAVFLVGLLICEHFIRANSVRIRAWEERAATQMKTPGSYIAIFIIFAVGISLLAEWSGMQFVIGAFFAGFLLSELTGAEKVEKTTDIIRGVTFGFFGPIAFSFIGVELVLSSIGGILLLTVTLLAVAIATKLFGGYVGARLTNFSPKESITIGFLMNSRGFVELVIASTAFQTGLIDQTLFSMVVSIGIITTIMSPIASRILLRRIKSEVTVRRP